MYSIYCDDTLIYDSTLKDYVITKGVVTKELNKSGSFVFTIYSSNPFYNTIQKMKSIITVFKGSELIFRGRVIKEVLGFYKDKTFTCEGELGFLLDSIVRPYEFTGTPEDMLKMLIDSHNAQVDETKRFRVGTVTVTDPNDYIIRSNTSYESVSDNLHTRLVDTLGGYLFITEDNGERVINWYAESPYRSSQPIEFGENLLDFTKTNGAEDIATAIIPLGYEITNEETGDTHRLTIAEVNNGVDYVYNEDAVNLYGWIYKVETWDDVTVASNLKTKGESFLLDKIKQSITIELSAIDLSLMDRSIDSFELGDYINIISAPHNIDDDYLLEKQTIDLLKPDNDKITLGYSYRSFTDKSVVSNNQNNTLAQKVEIIERNVADSVVITDELITLKSLIDQTSSSISSLISESFVDNDQLQSELSTLYTQLNNIFLFEFERLEKKVDDNDQTSRDEFSVFKNYIRFENGNIILGDSKNELTLKIEKDKITFYQGTLEVAYFSNAKMNIIDGEFINSLKIGNFAFIPRDNGNLSFMKVG